MGVELCMLRTYDLFSFCFIVLGVYLVLQFEVLIEVLIEVLTAYCQC